MKEIVLLGMGQSYTKRHSTLITNTINEDGELLETAEVGVDILVKGTANYYTTFMDHFGSVMKLDGLEVKIFFWCAGNCQLNTNEIALNKHLKQRIADEAQVSIRSVDNSLSKLCKKGFMHRIAMGHYMINPMVSFKGNVSEKTKKVRFYINYTIENSLPTLEEPAVQYKLQQ